MAKSARLCVRIIISKASRSPWMAARYCSRSLASIGVDLKPRRRRWRFRAKYFRKLSVATALCHRAYVPLAQFHASTERGGYSSPEGEQESINLDHVSGTDEIFHACGVPVRQPNATVAGGAPDRLWIVRAVNPDARFVESGPENADEIIWTRRKIVILLGADAVVEHAFVVAKPGPDGHAENFPGPFWRGQSGRSWRNRKFRHQLCAIVDFEKPLRRV